MRRERGSGHDPLPLCGGCAGDLAERGPAYGRSPLLAMRTPARRYGDTAAQERMGETAAGIGAETEAEVTDAGLELEKRTDAKLPGDAGRFRIRYSAGRGHKGAAIRSYDVSGEGRIAIAFSDERIGVYDRDMNCLFELFFEETGAYGVFVEGRECAVSGSPVQYGNGIQ